DMIVQEENHERKDRLKRLTGEGTTPVPKGSQKEIISELRARIDAIMSRRPAVPSGTSSPQVRRSCPLSRVIAGEEISNPLGQCFFSRSTFPSPSCHGNFIIGSLPKVDMKSAALLAGHPGIASLCISDALFLDTETTGLAGGTGTFAFLIGLGWFEGDDFVVCQLFARDFHEEAAMLTLLKEIAAEKRFLVTFNGRGFDLNLLSARFILSRLDNPFTGMPHLDLLFPGRKLLGHRLENCRLVTLESEVLGLRRTGDVPGYEIPARYFEWLRTGDASLLEDVSHHNRLDIVSMAALVYHLTGLLHGRPDAGSFHHGDLLAAAKLHLAQGDSATAEDMLAGLMSSCDRSVSRDAGVILSLHHKRQARWDEAVSIWEDMVASAPHDLFAVEELAKWLEHRGKDYDRAVGLIQRMLDGSAALSSSDKESLAHRLTRLRRKMGC
ncbi:hypothetical protein EG829_21585, partial [bacterium]|nr:hypothetical protein [bacterium]